MTAATAPKLPSIWNWLKNAEKYREMRMERSTGRKEGVVWGEGRKEWCEGRKEWCEGRGGRSGVRGGEWGVVWGEEGVVWGEGRGGRSGVRGGEEGVVWGKGRKEWCEGRGRTKKTNNLNYIYASRQSDPSAPNNTSLIHSTLARSAVTRPLSNDAFNDIPLSAVL
jgi:hypothetical protein